jgi:Rrf2 family iron-sulfur cluster assembly transcriptional regulator
MLLSPKERFAVSAMVDIALQEQVNPVPLSAMSVRLQISRPYLEVIFSQLRQKGLVVSTQGHRGGFSLGRPTNCITFADIIEAVKNKPQVKISAKLHSDKSAMPDPTEELLESLNLKMRDYMQSIQLCDLVDRQIKKDMKFNLITVGRHNPVSREKILFKSNSAFINANVATQQDMKHG